MGSGPFSFNFTVLKLFLENDKQWIYCEAFVYAVKSNTYGPGPGITMPP